MSIKRKLTSTIMGISVGAVVLTVAAISLFLIYDMQRSKQEELVVTSTITADRNSAALLYLDNERAEKNLEVFKLNPSILASCLYDSRGNLFAGYTSPSDGKSLTITCPPLVSQTPVEFPHLLIAHQDIISAGENIGHVFLASDTREIEIYMRKILMISGTVAVIVMGIALTFTLVFQRAISRPILELASTVQAITESRDYRLEARDDYTDETGMLARAFNGMLAEVRARDLELTRANETLEEKVILRTRELEASKQKAEQASEAKSEFLRNMSHEFRTPLHAMLSFSAYGLKESANGDRGELKEYFSLIQKGANRLTKLVNEVLDLSKLEHGESVFAMRMTDLAELCRRSIEQMQPLLDEKQLSLRISHQGAIMAVCDQDKIMQVIINMLSNAIKFTPKGRNITVEIGVDSFDINAVRLSVVDEGVGIPEEEREAIFESFRQSSRTNTGAGGTGLGLAICRRIIGAHGGHIWAENNQGAVGARVTFTMPSKAEEGTRNVMFAA